jgi:TM2 domain-containing membrane protein YozV
MSVGLLLGGLSPPALLLGLVAVVLGTKLGAGRKRLSSVGRGMTMAGLVAGLVCLVLTLLFLRIVSSADPRMLAN